MVIDPANTSGLIARKPGWCKWCGEEIRVWEHTIRKIESRGWVHETCADRAEGLVQVRLEHQVSEREEQQ